MHTHTQHNAAIRMSLPLFIAARPPALRKTPHVGFSQKEKGRGREVYRIQTHRQYAHSHLHLNGVPSTPVQAFT